jgi:hypothetical protein
MNKAIRRTPYYLMKESTRLHEVDLLAVECVVLLTGNYGMLSWCVPSWCFCRLRCIVSNSNEKKKNSRLKLLHVSVCWFSNNFLGVVTHGYLCIFNKRNNAFDTGLRVVVISNSIVSYSHKKKWIKKNEIEPTGSCYM